MPFSFVNFSFILDINQVHLNDSMNDGLFAMANLCVCVCTNTTIESLLLI